MVARPGWRTVMRHTAFFAAAVALPVLLVCALVTRHWVEAERDRYQVQTAELTARLTSEVERFLAARVVMLQALATSPALDDRSFDRFAEQARQLLDLEGMFIILRDRAGQEHVNSRLGPGAALPAVTFETDAAVLATQRPQISGLSQGRNSKLPRVIVSVPVLREGQVRYFLDAAMHPVVFGDLLRRAGVHEPYFGSIIDGTGLVIARSRNGGATVGRRLPGFDERPDERGVWTGPNMDGVRARTEYRRLPAAGWLISVGVVQDALDAPARWSAWLLAGLGAALVAVSALAAQPIVRRLRSAQRAAATASAISAENEARYRALADGLPQMVWVMDAADGRATYANTQFRAYYGDIGAERVERTGRNHPDDAERLANAWTEATQAGRPFVVEGRLRRADGHHRWHKLVVVPVPPRVGEHGRVVEWIGTALDIDDLVATRRGLEETTDLLRLAQDAAGAGVWEWDVGGDVIRLSAASARLCGLDVPDADATLALALEDWHALVWPEDMPAVWAVVERSLATGSPFVTEFRVGRRDGSAPACWLQSFGRVVLDARTGRPQRLVGLHIDTTARRESEEATRAGEARLRLSEERLALALDSGEDGIWDWDLPTDLVWVSDHWLTMLGRSAGRRVEMRAFADMVHPEDRERVSTALRDHLKGVTPSLTCEHRMLRRDGVSIWVLTRGRTVERAPDGRALRAVGTQIDISRRKEAEARIEHMALHDALTGLPNRLLFRDRLDRAIRAVARGRGTHAVLACDLDRFKAVNDTLGHPAGDRLLCAVAARIQAVLRPDDTVARLGGDEFALVLGGLDGDADAERVARRIIAAVDEPFEIDGTAIEIGVSVGGAMVEAGIGADELFKRADAALYEAKAAGRDTYRLFRPDAHARLAVRSSLALDLKEAIRRGDFFLVYQPIVDLRSGEAVGFEALMRWQHPERGAVSPADFIPLAEETGLIVPLGAWALAEACREAARWPDRVRVAVNVSGVQFRDGLEEAVMTALANARLDARRLALEVTESVLMRDADDALARLHRLRGLGVSIALDDFGTGYSSLSYLRRFPFDRIKIDRAFVRDIADPDAAAIMRAIVDLGHRLGKGIVVEGVETQDQLERVRREGCNEVQGFIFSRPLPAVDARAFVRARHSAVA